MDFRSFSVMAPIDTGINVYHDHFRTNETYPQWLLDGLGVTMVCDITLEGSYQDRLDADMETAGTKLLLPISFTLREQKSLEIHQTGQEMIYQFSMILLMATAQR